MGQVVGRVEISYRKDPSNQTNSTIRRLVQLWKQKQLKMFPKYYDNLSVYENSRITSISPPGIVLYLSLISDVSIKSHLGLERTLLKLVLYQKLTWSVFPEGDVQFKVSVTFT